MPWSIPAGISEIRPRSTEWRWWMIRPSTQTLGESSIGSENDAYSYPAFDSDLENINSSESTYDSDFENAFEPESQTSAVAAAFQTHVKHTVPWLLSLSQIYVGYDGNINQRLNLAFATHDELNYDKVARAYFKCLKAHGFIQSSQTYIVLTVPESVCGCQQQTGQGGFPWESDDSDDGSESIERGDDSSESEYEEEHDERGLIRAPATSKSCLAKILSKTMASLVLLQRVDMLCEAGKKSLASRGKTVIVLTTSRDAKEVPVIESLRCTVLGEQESSERIPTQEKTIKAVLQSFQEQLTSPVIFEGGLLSTPFLSFINHVCSRLDQHSSEPSDIVANEVRTVVARNLARLLDLGFEGGRDAEQPVLITTEDLHGKEPDPLRYETPEWQELQNMVGMKKVKSSIKSLFDGLLLSYWRRVNGHDSIPIALSRAFLGPPGTGKTTVAKLYGKILAKLELLSKGDLIVKSAGEFISPYSGESAEKARKILKESLGCVLLIDEAYMLDPHRGRGGSACARRTEVLDTIVSEVQNVPGEDRCIIMCGYNDDMEQLLLHSNPGLRRRFPLEQAFIFEDFSDLQMGQILDLKMQSLTLTTTEEGRAAAMHVLQLAKQRPHFGNAGEVDNLLSRAALSYQARFGTQKVADRLAIAGEGLLVPEDFDPAYNRGVDASTRMDQDFRLLGLDKQRSFLKSLARQAEGMKRFGKDPKLVMPFTLVLKGPPGCGKTTFAKHLGKIYHDMGIIATAEVVESSASDIIAEFLGQTGPKTRRLLESALGKILLIDEAYRLNDQDNHSHSYVREAVGELVDAITKPAFARKLVIVLVGYTSEIDTMLCQNPGLSSRFPTHIVFEPLSSRTCVALLKRAIESLGVVPGFSEDDQLLREHFDKFKGLEHWASGRDTETIAQEAVRKCFEAYGKEAGTGIRAISSALPTVPRSLMLQVVQLWGSDRGLSNEFISKSAGAHKLNDRKYGNGSTRLRDTVKKGAFVYDVLDRDADVIRVLSFEDGRNDTISVRLETVDFGSRKSAYEFWHRNASAVYKHNFPDGYVSDAQKDGMTLFVWKDRNCEGEPEERLSKWVARRDTTEDILRADRKAYVDHRYTWGDYFALSYVWGSPADKKEILLNGHRFLVNQSLYRALQKLRQSDEVRLAKLKVWIDAICINQEDAEERNFQVGKMRAIYTKAVCVRAWLGDPPPEGAQGYKHLRQAMGTKLDSVNSGSLPGLHGTTFDDDTLRSMHQAAHEIFSLKYWERLWIIQEMALAHSIVFWYGDSWLNLRHLSMWPEEMVLRRTPEIMKGLMNVWVVLQKLQRVRKGLNESEQLFHGDVRDCVEVALLSRAANATVPRDKVYGILGLLNPSISELVEIDYAAPVTIDQAALSFSKACIQVEGNPALRGQLYMSSRQCAGHGLPTWAFDFTSPIQMTDWSVIDCRASRKNQARRLSPVAQSEIVRFSPDSRLLTCQGLLIDVVNCLSEEFLKDPWADEVDDGFKQPAATETYGNDNFTPLRSPAEIVCGPGLQLHAPSDAHLSLARTLLLDPSYNHADGLSPLQLKWAVIEDVYHARLDHVPGSASDSLHMLEWLYVLCGFIYLNRVFSVGDRRLQEHFETGLEWSSPSLDITSDVLDDLRAKVPKALRGRLMTSSRGFFGCVPGMAREGDIIAALSGSDEPVILRSCPGKSCYQLIGVCFVDGLMLGEPWTEMQQGLGHDMITLC